MELLADANISARAAVQIREDGHDIISICDINRTMSDDRIVVIARLQKRIIITHDKDFGELIFRRGMKHAGIIILRIGDQSWQEEARVIRAFLYQHLADELIDNFWVVTDNGAKRASNGRLPD